MRRAIFVLVFSALTACSTETIELRTGQPDAAPDAEPTPDAPPARCVCLRACADARDCLGLGSEICDLATAVCEETEPLTECTTSASCADGRECVREDDPGAACE